MDRRFTKNFADISLRIILVLLLMFFFFGLPLLTSGCILKCQKQETQEVIRFVDYKTYQEWGTTNLHPFGRRPIPHGLNKCTEQEKKTNVSCP